MSKRKTPILRFKGFNNAWEQRKLGDIVTPIKTYSLTRAFETLKNTNFKYIHYGDIHTGKAKIIQNPSTLPSIKKNDNYITLKPNDIIIADASEDYKGIADAAILKDCGNYKIVAGLHTIAIRPNSCNVSSFIYILLGRDDFKHWGYKVGTGLKVFGITLKNFLKYKTFYPSLNEQKRIGNLLNLVDNLLVLQKRKYEELKLLKKALMQNMFADNAFYPNLRFKGFVYKWKQYKLNDLGYTFSGLSGKSKKDFGHGKAQYVTYMNVFSNPIANLEMTEHIEIDNKQNSVKYNDIFFTTSSETPEEVGMSSIWLGKETNTYLNSFCFGFRLTKRIDSYYIAFMLRSPSFRRKMMVLAQGISRFNISKNKVMNIKILLPKISEQKRVGITIKKVDNTVKLQVKFINKIKKFRKFLLQNMFI
jgi:type I restriction enzyme S subunit